MYAEDSAQLRSELISFVNVITWKVHSDQRFRFGDAVLHNLGELRGVKPHSIEIEMH